MNKIILAISIAAGLAVPALATADLATPWHDGISNAAPSSESVVLIGGAALLAAARRRRA